MLKDKDTNLLLIINGIFNGVIHALGAIVSFFCEAYGLNTQDTSNFGISTILGSMVGTYVIGHILQKTFAYKKILIVSSNLASLSLFGLYFAAQDANRFWINFSTFLLGFFTVSILPLSADFIVELNFPIPEAYSSGLLHIVRDIYSTFLILLASGLVDLSKSRTGQMRDGLN